MIIERHKRVALLFDDDFLEGHIDEVRGVKEDRK